MKKLLLLPVLLFWCLISAAQNPGNYKFNGEQNVFTENLGQVTDEDGKPVPDVLAKASIAGLDIYLTKTGVTYILQRYEEDLTAKPHPVFSNEKHYSTKYSRVDVALTGATLSHDQMLWTGEAGWKSNYYKTADAKGQLAVSHYNTVTIQNVYPGIDWVWKFNDKGQPEYDFVVHPGADAGVIKMQYSYADLKPAGNNLTISAPLGSLIEGPLKASCSNAKVQIGYNVDAQTKQVSFNATGYDKAKDLLIDPPLALDWSAQFGGGFQNGLRGVSEDSVGGIYLCGYSTSPNFATHNPGGGAYFSGTIGGQSDAIILKLDTLQTLKWATFMGGAGTDFANSLCYSYYQNQLIVTGGAQTGFPITNGPATATGQDMFVTTISTTNLALLQSNFYGGNGTDEGLKVRIFNYSYICVVGYTNSTGNSFANVASGSQYNQTTVTGQEAFITTFINYYSSGSLMRPYWGSKFGGNGDDYATSVTSDSLNNLIVTGYTNSTNLPVNQAGTSYYQSSNGGGYDGFIAKFNPNFQLANATYYGGSGNDYFNDVTTGVNGNFFFTGRTNSPNFPIDSIAGYGFNQTHLADTTDDAFIVKLDNNNALKWGTYYGGNAADAGTGISTDGKGQIYVTGFTFSTNFPVLAFPGAYNQAIDSGNADGFVARFTDLGVRSWSTYKGDSCYQYPYGISYDRHFNKFYVAGEGLLACGQSLPDTNQVGQNGVSSVGFCWAFTGQTTPPACSGFSVQADVLRQPCPNQCNGQAQAVVFNGHTPYKYAWSSGGTGNTDNNLCPSESWIEIQDSLGCNTETAVVYNPLKLTLASTGIVCLPGPGVVSVTATGGNGADTYQWSTSPGHYTDSTQVNVSDTGLYSVTVQDASGCTASASIEVSFINYTANGQLEITSYPYCSYPGGTIQLNNPGTDPLFPNGNVTWTLNNAIVATGDVFNGVLGSNNSNFNFYIAVDSAFCYNGVTSPVSYEFYLFSPVGAAQLYTTPPTSCTSFNGTGYVDLEPASYEILGNNAPPTNYGTVTGYPGLISVNVDFNWSNGEYGQQVNNLGNGSYSVTVSDNCYITVLTAEFALAGPQVTPVITPASCGTSTVNLVVTGTDGPYKYHWPNGATTDTVTNLSNGSYVVTVTGTDSCYTITTINVTGGQVPFTVSLTTAGITCQGTVTATVSGTGAPYLYEWSTSPGQFSDSMAVFVSDSGLYKVSVKNDSGCIVRDSIEVPFVFYYPNETVEVIQYPSCGNSDDIVTLYGALGDVSWWVNQSGGRQIVATGDTFYNANANTSGDYTVYSAIDSGFCYNGHRGAVQYDFTVLWAVGQPFITVTQPTDCNTSNGSLQVIAGGSSIFGSMIFNGDTIATGYQIQHMPPISYHWSNGDTTAQITGLGAGTYTVTISNGVCNQVQTRILTVPTINVVPIIDTPACAYGSINVSNVSGVSGPYSYHWSTGSTGNYISNLPSGTYIVTITATGSGCTLADTFHIPAGNPIYAYITPTGITCAPGMAIVSIGQGHGPFQYEWSTSPGHFGDSSTIYVQTAGAYTVTVEGAGNCTASATVNVPYNNTVSPQITLTYPSCLDANGFLSINAPDSLSSWEYPDGTVVPGSMIGNVYASDSLDEMTPYIVTDSSNCFNGVRCPIQYSVYIPEDVYFNSMTINQLATCDTTVYPTGQAWIGWGSNAYGLPGSVYPQSVPFVTSASSCGFVVTYPNEYAGSNLQTFAPGSLTYTWSVGGFNNGPLTVSGDWLMSLPPGNYAITITDGACQVVDTVIMPADTPFVNYTANVLCTYDTTAGSETIISTSGGGGNPFTYQWSNGDTTGSISNLTFGIYTVTITGPNTCTHIQSYEVTPGDFITIHDSITPIACNGGQATVAITVTGTPAGYTGAGNFIRPPGTYNFTVNDYFGCYATDTVVITQPQPLVVKDSAIGGNCSNGNFIISATGGTAPYTGTGTFTRTPGTYYMTVSDAHGCSKTDTVVVTAGGGSLSVSLNSAGITCAPGTVNATVTGNGGPYQYEWSTSPGHFGDSASIFISDSGLYAVTVEAAGGCSGTAAMHVGYNNLAPIDYDIVIEQYPSCGLSNGVIYFTDPNPSKVSWLNESTGAVSYGDTLRNVSTISNINGGLYTINDTSNCFNGQPSLIQYVLQLPDAFSDYGQPLPLDIISPTGCNSYDGWLGVYIANNPQFNATILNYAPITYQWSNGVSYTIDNNDDGDYYTGGLGLEFLNPGYYSVTVTDGTCRDSATTELLATLPPLVANYIVTAPACTNASNDSIKLIRLTNNVGIDTFSWSNGATTSSISHIATGTYTVTITGPNACPVIDSFHVSDTSYVLTITDSITPIACFNGSATVTITATGGVSPYHGTGTFIRPPGNYVFVVTDTNGCSGTDSLVVQHPPVQSQLSLIDTTSAILCHNGTASIVIIGEGGLPPYTGTGTYTKPAGTYILPVHDALGCTVYDTITLTQPTQLTANISPGTIACYGDSTTITVSASGGTRPYTGTGTITRPAGNYGITVADNNGCNVTDSVAITQPSRLQVTDSVGTVLCYGGQASVHLTATGGTQPYFGAGVVLKPAGNYELMVTDVNGCRDSVHVSITQPTQLNLGLTVLNDGHCIDSVKATVSATGGTAPYTDTGNQIYTHNGNYTITVADANGCTTDSVLTVTLDTCTGVVPVTVGTGVTVYPNPSPDKFFVKFGAPVGAETFVRMYAVDGKLVMLRTIGAGADLCEMDCTSLAVGVYVMKTKAEGVDYYFKVVVER